MSQTGQYLEDRVRWLRVENEQAERDLQHLVAIIAAHRINAEPPRRERVGVR